MSSLYFQLNVGSHDLQITTFRFYLHFTQRYNFFLEMGLY